MKYFIVDVNENYIAPKLVDWYGIIDKKTLSRKKAYEMPKHLLFHIEKHMQMVFTDVLTVPCFMVSEMVRDVINKYVSSVWFLRIILYDNEQKRSMAYYIPYLEKINYSEEKDTEKKNNHRVCVKKEDIKEKIIVEITAEDRSYVVMRMDLVESILRRETIGIGLREIKII